MPSTPCSSVLGETWLLLCWLHYTPRECRHKRIVVKGLSEEHGRILASMGVERVVFPEIEMAQNLADRMTWPNVLDYVPIDPEYSVVEFTVPPSLAGKSRCSKRTFVAAFTSGLLPSKTR